ncbi:MAG: hypothetical protein IK997_05315 [Bacilli bacterium]|nr:hypothetical protein [Bacilli bacterium]
MNIDLTLFQKLKLIFKYFFSSFMPIELLIIVLCVFLFLFFNLKRNKTIVNIFIPIIILLFVAFMAMGFHEYTKSAFEEVIKLIMHYYYFPSMTFYFVIIIFTTIYLIRTVYTEKVSKKFKIFNYSFSFILFSLFVGLFSYVISNHIGLSIDYSIYKDQYILSFIQISNLVFVLWLFIIGIIKLYNYFKKKYD